MLKNMKIGKKMLMLIGLAISFLLITSVSGYKNMKQMAQNTESMYEKNLKPIQYLDQMRVNNRTVDSYSLEFMITKDAAVNKELETNIKEKLAETEGLMGDYESVTSDEKELKKFALFKEKFQMYKSQVQELQALARENKNNEAYNLYLAKVKETRSIMNQTGNELAEINSQAAHELNLLNQAKVKQASSFSFILAAISIGLFSLLSFLIVRMITNPLKDMQLLMKKAQNGDLNVKGDYKSNDEIGLLTRSFNEMMGGLRHVVRQVTATAEQIAASAGQLTANSEETNKATELISSTMEKMANGSDQQLHQVSETAATVSTMSRGVQQIASSAQQLSATAASAGEKTADGHQSITKAVTQMNAINETFAGLSHAIAGLGDRSKEIGQIINSITNIAAQTNLLALNAAIEAARAGEQGRGFAVVADEVRKLAEESASSAKQIAALIANIQHETATAVESMFSATAEVAEGIAVVNSAGGAFEKINESISEVTGQIQEVSSAAKQMAAGTDQIVNSMNMMTELSKFSASSTQNVSAASEEQMASMEEIASSAAALFQIAEELKSITDQFNT